MKKSVITLAAIVVLSASTLTASAAMNGVGARPQAMGGSDPRPQSMAMGGSDPRPQIGFGGFVSAILLYFGL